jgi:hypothetical protein
MTPDDEEYGRELEERAEELGRHPGGIRTLVPKQ